MLLKQDCKVRIYSLKWNIYKKGHDGQQINNVVPKYKGNIDAFKTIIK